MNKLDEAVKRASGLTPLEIKLRDALHRAQMALAPAARYQDAAEYRSFALGIIREALAEANRIERERGK